LLRFGYGSAEVFLAGHQQSRRLHIFHQRNYRALHIVVGVIPGIAGEPGSEATCTEKTSVAAGRSAFSTKWDSGFLSSSALASQRFLPPTGRMTS
jgi:hypothetical protein